MDACQGGSQAWVCDWKEVVIVIVLVVCLLIVLRCSVALFFPLKFAFYMLMPGTGAQVMLVPMHSHAQLRN